MNKWYYGVLLLTAVIGLVYSGAVNSKIACGQNDVFASGGGCGIDRKEPGFENAIEVSKEQVETGGRVKINGKMYRCEKMSGGNCRDRTTYICQNPQEIKPKYITGGIEKEAQKDFPTNWYDKNPVKVEANINENNRPPLQGGADVRKQQSFQVLLPVKGQQPIVIRFDPPYRLNWAQPILPQFGDNFQSAIGEPTRRKNGTLALKITKVVLNDGTVLPGPFYRTIPANIKL